LKRVTKFLKQRGGSFAKQQLKKIILLLE